MNQLAIITDARLVLGMRRQRQKKLERAEKAKQ